MFKLLKILKILKILKFLKMSNYQRYFKIFFLLLAPHVTVPVVLWAEACPFASSSTESLSTTGLNVYVYKKPFNLKLRGVESKLVLWGRMVLGVMPPVHVQGPVCPDHVAASAWLPTSWLCRFGCPSANGVR